MLRDVVTRRTAVRRLAAAAAGLGMPPGFGACREVQEPADADLPMPAATEALTIDSDDHRRLYAWIETLQREGFDSSEIPFGHAVVRVGELALGTPYEGATLEEYIRAGGSPMRTEPLTLSLTRFDCVSLVESCLAIARVARSPEPPSWDAYASQMERMRYRGGNRAGYASRLHYFSDWLHDNERRGLVRLLGRDLGGTADQRPLRFMSGNPDAYPAMAHREVREEIAAVERSLDPETRWVIPTARIPAIEDRLESGDILAFATSIDGLDVSHAAFAYRDGRAVRVLHAPLSGGVVEITRSTVHQYVSAIRRATGILVARPLQG